MAESKKDPIENKKAKAAEEKDPGQLTQPDTGQGRKDPVDAKQAEVQEKRDLEEVKSMDIAKLDFRVTPEKRAAVGHPMDGYPIKPPVDRGGDVPISATFIVGLNPAEVPIQDVSGKGVSIPVYTKSGKLTEQTKLANLGTYHSRFLRCYEAPYSGDNYDVVFDNLIEYESGERLFYAIVPYHSLRAQLMYVWDTRGDPPRIRIDKRYVFADTDQASRLRQLFQLIINPKIKVEQMAAMVSGEVEATEAQLEKLPTEV